MVWQEEFRQRIDRFEKKTQSDANTYSLSIKIRNVDVGCYSRGCCPNAYKLIDDEIALTNDKNNYLFIEHETGPELLAYVTLSAAGLSLASSIINLVITIIKARFEGQKKGDNHKYPVELIVRRTDKKGKFKEEKVLRVNSLKEFSDSEIEKELKKSIKKLLKNK